jgi:hypothetical protein
MVVRSESIRVYKARESLKEALENLAASNMESPKQSKSRHDLNENDLHVIKADVHRSAVFWDIHKFMKQSHRIRRRKALAETLHTLLESQAGLRYYQGLHDVCLVVLEITGGDKAQAIRLLHPLIRSHFSKFLTMDFDAVIPSTLATIQKLVRRHDAALDDQLESSGFGYHFAIPWILTWFAHTMDSFQDVCAVFDFILRKKGSVDIHHIAAAFLLEGRDVLLKKLHEGTTKALEATMKSVRLTRAFVRAVELTLIPEEPLPSYYKPKTDIETMTFLKSIFVIVGFATLLTASFLAYYREGLV